MRFVTFKVDGQVKLGVANEEVTEIIDLEKLQKQEGGTFSLPSTMIEAVAMGESFVEDVKELLNWANQQATKSWVYGLENVELLAPIPKTPKNILCIGKNYAAHAIEMGSAEDIPKHPMVFTKAHTTINTPYGDVLSHSDITEQLDYEGELAVVIGKKGSKIPKEEAFNYVFGYTMINDITARDLQKRHKQYFLGKSLDTACPMGPFIAHKSLIENPHHLNIETRVNGEVRQSANTEQFIFDIPTLISTLSQGTTLEPGDIIATGTPAGVGNGFNPPKFLKAGDVVEVHVDGLGWLKNRIVE